MTTVPIVKQHIYYVTILEYAANLYVDVMMAIWCYLNDYKIPATFMVASGISILHALLSLWDIKSLYNNAEPRKDQVELGYYHFVIRCFLIMMDFNVLFAIYEYSYRNFMVIIVAISQIIMFMDHITANKTSSIYTDENTKLMDVVHFFFVAYFSRIPFNEFISFFLYAVVKSGPLLRRIKTAYFQTHDTWPSLKNSPF